MGYIFEEELLMLLPGLLSGVPAGLFSVAAYVLTAWAIYTISRRRGLRNSWLAWVPVVNCWLLGSLSDQYQYVVKGEVKSKRKWLLALDLIKAVLALTVAVLAVIVILGAFFSDPGYGMRQSVAAPLMGILGILLPLAAVHIASLVIRYMALYDVYRSVDPDNSVLYLVLSILFSPTEPFFLFFNREKDLGMPPRKQKPVQEPVYEQYQEYETVEDAESL